MLVKFKYPWFAPSAVERVDKLRVRSGQRFDVGVHEVPEKLKDVLPSSAEIVDKRPKEEVEEQSHNLQDYDAERADADEFAKMVEEAEETRAEKIKKKRQANMAKAREAAARKKKEAKKKEG